MSDQSPTSPRFVDERERYRLDSRIATGGMGEVWRGTDTQLGRPVAVKVLKHEYADDPSFRSRFATEAQHAAALDHPGVAKVYDVGESPATSGSPHPRPFLVMELVDGEPLSTILSQGRQSGRTVDRDVLRDLLAQSATAIGAAHAAGIVHRDVKPANLLVTRDRRIKITDFGIARAADAVGITQTGQVMGTPQYLSPEQARGEQATPASDVYALGVVAFECLAGRRPFEADSPVATALAHLQQPVPDLPDDVPDDLAQVVRTALAKDPADRFPDGAAFAAALRDPATAVLPGGLAAGAAAAGAAGLGAAAAYDDDATRVLGATSQQPAATGPVEPVTPVEPVRVGRAEESDSRAKVLVPIVAGIVLLLLVLIGVFALRGGDETGGTEPGSGDESATATPSPSEDATTQSAEPTPTPSPTPEEPATVSISSGDYEGDNVEDVVRELDSLGFAVARSEQTNDGSGEEGEVIGVSPDGELPEGASVTVSYLGAAPEPEPTPTPTPSQSGAAQREVAPGDTGDAGDEGDVVAPRPGELPTQRPEGGLDG